MYMLAVDCVRRCPVLIMLVPWYFEILIADGSAIIRAGLQTRAEKTNVP